MKSRNDFPDIINKSNKSPKVVEIGESKIKEKYGNKENVHLIKEKSCDAAQLFQDEYFDWCYIDADHSYEAVKEDILAWWPKVKLDGIIFGHDFDPEPKDTFFRNYGVSKAVSKIFAGKFSLTQEVYWKSWYVAKKEQTL